MTDQTVTGDATGGVIPYKNVPALMAYYCAIFSLIPCFGFVLGAVALVLGIVGLLRYKKTPQVSGVVHAWIGILLGGLIFLLHVAAAVFLGLEASSSL